MAAPRRRSSPATGRSSGCRRSFPGSTPRSSSIRRSSATHCRGWSTSPWWSPTRGRGERDRGTGRVVRGAGPRDRRRPRRAGRRGLRARGRVRRAHRHRVAGGTRRRGAASSCPRTGPPRCRPTSTRSTPARTSSAPGTGIAVQHGAGVSTTSPRGTVIMALDRCKGCALVRAGLPARRARDDRPNATPRDTCSHGCSTAAPGCRACADVCPDFVFEVYRFDLDRPTGVGRPGYDRVC